MRLEIKNNPYTNTPDAVVTIDAASLFKLIDALKCAAMKYGESTESIQASKEINHLALLIESDLMDAINNAYEDRS